MTPRRPRPDPRLDVWGAVGATLLAWVAYLVSRQVGVLPDRGFGVVLFTIAPSCAAVATVVLWVRGRADHDPAVSWVATGLAVGLAAMVLQLVSFPAVSRDGGPLGTGGNGSSLLYLLFHWSLLLSAVAGAARTRQRWQPWALAAGLVVVVLSALNLIPTPLLLTPDGGFTPLLLLLEQITAVAALAATVFWMVRSGRRAPALRGWIAVALAFNTHDTLFNLIAGRRYDHVWWASLSMRVATYAVLAAAATLTVLVQLRRHDQYTEAELTRREGELRTALGATSQLLASSEALTSAVTEADVAHTAAVTIREATGARQVIVETLDTATGQLRLLAAVEREGLADLDPAGPARLVAGPHVLRTGQPVYTGCRAETERQFGDLSAALVLHDAVAVAALPLRLATGRVGALVIGDDRERDWPDHERQLLAGLADQAAQALQRAHLFERERATADALQRGMLPDQLTTADGVEVTARYLPGAQGLRVGGDWYDSIPLPDGRNILVVGDVMGKGAVAAAVMGRARSVVRALVTTDPRPGAVLQRLDRISDELTPDGFITMLYVLLDPAEGVAEIACAGHLPLLVAAADGSVRLVTEGRSPAVGLPAVNRATARIAVPTGSTLALYTDGLVEDRASGLDRGLRELTEAFDGHGEQSLADLADRLLTLGASAREYDDVCLLLARLAPLSDRPPRVADSAAGEDRPRPATTARPAACRTEHAARREVPPWA